MAYNRNNPKNYADTFNPTDQVGMEEKISSIIFDIESENEGDLGEEACNDLGRIILRTVLEEFRPDLFEGKKP